jgi:hypothetical protein
MSEQVKRPLQLTAAFGVWEGTEESRAAIIDAYDSAFEFYSELLSSSWDHDESLRAARGALISGLRTIINRTAEEVDSNE